MNFKSILSIAVMTTLLFSCNDNNTKPSSSNTIAKEADFNVMAESFADLQVLRYQVPGFEGLSSKEKELVYYLYEASLCGRDIIYDQKSKYGILLRKTIEAIYGTYKGDKKTDDWKKFQDYCGRFWFSNGNHHHYGMEKFTPECSADYFKSKLLPKLHSVLIGTDHNIELDAEVFHFFGGLN